MGSRLLIGISNARAATKPAQLERVQPHRAAIGARRASTF
jgi:hypothetical protein